MNPKRIPLRLACVLLLLALAAGSATQLGRAAHPPVFLPLVVMNAAPPPVAPPPSPTPVPVAPITRAGSGPAYLLIDKWPGGALFAFTHFGAGNFTVKGASSYLEWFTLVEGYGAATTRTPFDYDLWEPGWNTDRLEIQTDGAWEFTISPLTDAYVDVISAPAARTGLTPWVYRWEGATPALADFDLTDTTTWTVLALDGAFNSLGGSRVSAANSVAIIPKGTVYLVIPIFDPQGALTLIPIGPDTLPNLTVPATYRGGSENGVLYLAAAPPALTTLDLISTPDARADDSYLFLTYYDAAYQLLGMNWPRGLDYHGDMLIPPAARYLEVYVAAGVGAWTLHTYPLTAAHRLTVPGSYAGVGDDVLRLEGDPPGDTLFAFRWQAGIDVTAYDANLGRIYTLIFRQGREPGAEADRLPAAAKYLVIETGGPWTLTVPPPD